MYAFLGQQPHADFQIMSRRSAKVSTWRTLCNGCGRLVGNHENHRRFSGCAPPAALTFCQPAEEECEEPKGEDVFSAADDTAAADVALGLAELKYERGFQRPDVDAAKKFAGVVGKRTHEMAFDRLKGLLRDDVDPADVFAGLCIFAPPAALDQHFAARLALFAFVWLARRMTHTHPFPCAFSALQSAGADAFKGVETEAKHQAYLKRNLPMLDVRVSKFQGCDHQIASVNVNDAIIRMLQEVHMLQLPPPPSALSARTPRATSRESWRLPRCWQTVAQESWRLPRCWQTDRGARTALHQPSHCTSHRRRESPFVCYSMCYTKCYSMCHRAAQNKSLFEKTKTKSDNWKKGDKWKQVEPDYLDDLDAGSVARYHFDLMRPAGPSEERDIRVGVLLYGDEVETVDTGYAKSKHKLLGVQAALANLEAEDRFNHDNQLLLAVARHPAVMHAGMTGIFAGVDKNGKEIVDGPTISADFIEGAEGRWFKVLDDDGTEQWYRLKTYVLVVCGDYPQVQAMLPFMEAAGAYCPCRGCNYRQDGSMAHETPHSFFSQGCKWKQRNAQALLAQIREWRACEDSAAMQAAGVNKLEWALMDKYFPGINFANIAPQDIMHTFADGITRHEAAWMLYMFHSRGYLKLAVVNDAILKYQWPRDCRVPRLPDNVKDGETGNFPRQSATLGLSASQTFTFAIHRHIEARESFTISRLHVPLTDHVHCLICAAYGCSRRI